MEEYKGFLIDTDTSDHNATVTGEINGAKIKAHVFRNTSQAKAFIDGIILTLNKTKKV